MPVELLEYLFRELKDHTERLKEEAYKDNPDIEIVDYHFDKSTSIIDMIEKSKCIQVV